MFIIASDPEYIVISLVMSADLWAAFAGASDDLSSNPWSSSTTTQAQEGPQAASQLKHNSVKNVEADRMGTNDAFPDQPQSPWTSSNPTGFPYKPPQPSATSSGKPLPSFESADLNEWSGWESPSVSANGWSGNENTASSLPSSSQYEEHETSKDDWGDFEVPGDGLSQRTHALTVRSEKQMPSREDLAPPYLGHQALDTSKPSQQMPAADTLKASTITDPGKSKPLVMTQRRGIKAVGPPSFLTARETPSVSRQVSYSQEEWGEFSPDPVISPNLGKTASADALRSTAPGGLSMQQSPKVFQQSSQVMSEPHKQVSSAPVQLPPTNVPPPSILISLVSSLIEKLPAQIESAMKSFSQSGGSDKALETALRKCISSLRVAARIAAGRKVRWKRDTHLAQSMRIGQAGKGMKLSGVNRSELKREDREAAEFVQIWHKRLGSIRRALAMVNSQIAGDPLALPDISETMLIRTVKPEDGGILSANCCVLCGLKREERVDKVDIDVYDAFNEWWMEHWGHMDCTSFWVEHERYLQQR